MLEGSVPAEGRIGPGGPQRRSLAVLIPCILELVIENAQNYSESLHIDDAFLYSPDSIEVLSAMRPTTDRALSCLRRVATNDTGAAKWATSEALLDYQRPT